MIAHFTFHGALNDFVPRRQRHTTIAHWFDWKASVKDMLESLGPPHPEVQLIVVNGVSVGVEYIVQHEDRIDVYDDMMAVEIAPKVRLIPDYPGRPRFVLDTHLGRSAAYLRMLGFDTLYRNDYADDELARISDEEQRILLTRDIGLLKRGRVVYGYFVRNTDPRQSLREIAARFDLIAQIEPFRYCMKCNGQLVAVAKEAIRALLKPGTAEYYDTFHQCRSCGQVYWRGSHYDKMEKMLEEMIAT